MGKIQATLQSARDKEIREAQERQARFDRVCVLLGDQGSIEGRQCKEIYKALPSSNPLDRFVSIRDEELLKEVLGKDGFKEIEGSLSRLPNPKAGFGIEASRLQLEVEELTGRLARLEIERDIRAKDHREDFYKRNGIKPGKSLARHDSKNQSIEVEVKEGSLRQKLIQAVVDNPDQTAKILGKLVGITYGPTTELNKLVELGKLRKSDRKTYFAV